MMDRLPANSLITADAGFVGYDVWSRLLAAGHDLLIRVGGNVRLLKTLGYVRESHGTVYLWPDETARRGQPPLVLRLVVVQGGRHPWYLVTSVLRRRELSDRQIAEIYRRRWGIELFYRHFKQTFARRKLRSQAAEHVLCEAHWSLLGLWAMLLYAQQHQLRRRVPPERLSVAGVLRAFRGLLKQPVAGSGDGSTFHQRLDQAVVDGYSREQTESQLSPQEKGNRGRPSEDHHRHDEATATGSDLQNTTESRVNGVRCHCQTVCGLAVRCRNNCRSAFRLPNQSSRALIGDQRARKTPRGRIHTAPRRNSPISIDLAMVPGPADSSRENARLGKSR